VTPSRTSGSEADQPYGVVYSHTAKRELSETLPEKVATAAFEFISGPLRDDPYRVGAALDPPLAPARKARRADYRVIYLVDEVSRTIEIVTVQHRSDVYHSAPRRLPGEAPAPPAA
jgi:mRNA interferase RelE/StbE